MPIRVSPCERGLRPYGPTCFITQLHTSKKPNKAKIYKKKE